MISYYAGLAAVAVLMGAIYVFRGDADKLSLLHETKDKLLPFAGPTASARFADKQELWRAIGGAAGVLKILMAAGAISNMAARCAHKYPNAQTAAETIFWEAMWLRVVAVWCLYEAAMCWMFPKCPRTMAGGLVRLYCDLVLDLEAAESIGSVA